jgi:hypothetical protein
MNFKLETLAASSVRLFCLTYLTKKHQLVNIQKIQMY